MHTASPMTLMQLRILHEAGGANEKTVFPGQLPESHIQWGLPSPSASLRVAAVTSSLVGTSAVVMSPGPGSAFGAALAERAIRLRAVAMENFMLMSSEGLVEAERAGEERKKSSFP